MRSKRPSTEAVRHVAGGCLLLLALGSLVFAGWLPMRSTSTVAPGFLENIDTAIVVAYAGYPGCGDVCPAGMAMLSMARRSLADPSDTTMLFINLQRGTPHAVTSAYAEAFHPDFKSYTVAFDEADHLYEQLALRSFSTDESAASHSDSYYVFIRAQERWRIEHVYRRAPSSDQLVDDLERISTSLPKGT